MLKFGSKKNLSNENKCTIRLLDDNEVVECEFQVSNLYTYVKNIDNIVIYKTSN